MGKKYLKKMEKISTKKLILILSKDHMRRK
jgi:hypothetical protein